MASQLNALDLKKLSVPQLKLLCKEKAIAGYSKLNKDAIIGKLLNWQSKQGSSAGAPVSKPLSEVPSRSVTTPIPSNLRHYNAVLQTGDLPPTIVTLGGSRPDPNGGKTKTELEKRSRGDSEADDHQATELAPKKKKTSSTFPGTVSGSIQATACQSPSNLDSRALNTAGQRTLPAQLAKRHCITNSPPDEARKRASPLERRFKPLVMRKDGSNAVARPGVSQATTSATEASTFSGYSDFPLETQISLKVISLPPSLAQRKHIPSLSVILSGISLKDLMSCALVSRSFRYAAYVAATHQLSRQISGERLQQILTRYSPKMFNYWPYLAIRQQEMESRRRTYEASFISQACKGFFGIDERLWFSPDHEKQANIAVRFVLTRLFFFISTGQWHEDMKASCSTVLDVQEVVEGEIWKIKHRCQSVIQDLFVLESTCEVIGKAEVPSRASPVPCINNLRVDWAEYVQDKVRAASLGGNSGSGNLSDHLHWPNHEEYSKGISKLWLTRIQTEERAGEGKLVVAQRYVLACVTCNSVSGSWRTANEMAQEFDGRPALMSSRDYKTKRVNLFLPTHHHVESVHFTSSNGHDLHPALAVVQTPGREYYILRDNGMQVGCEEEGVAEVWMKTLGCRNDGSV